MFDMTTLSFTFLFLKFYVKTVKYEGGGRRKSEKEVKEVKELKKKTNFC